VSFCLVLNVQSHRTNKKKRTSERKEQKRRKYKTIPFITSDFLLNYLLTELLENLPVVQQHPINGDNKIVIITKMKVIINNINNKI
jgi:hypothetical protein